MSTRYTIYYKKDATYREDSNLTRNNFRNTHNFAVSFMLDGDLDDVYREMQGEFMLDFIREIMQKAIRVDKLFCHTSMSIGDIILDENTDTMYEVASCGFNVVRMN